MLSMHMGAFSSTSVLHFGSPVQITGCDVVETLFCFLHQLPIGCRLACA